MSEDEKKGGGGQGETDHDLDVIPPAPKRAPGDSGELIDSDVIPPPPPSEGQGARLQHDVDVLVPPPPGREKEAEVAGEAAPKEWEPPIPPSIPKEPDEE